MNEDQKRQFDAWESMRDHAWREFEEKSGAEWRLSFGIWAALLASAGALIAAGTATVAIIRQQVTPCVIVLTVLVVVIHATFLYWVHKKLQSARCYLFEAQEEMRKLLKTPSKQHKRSIWQQVPIYVEFVITILLAGIFLVVFMYS